MNPDLPPTFLALENAERQITGMSAILLPFDSSGSIDWTSFARLIERTLNAGLTPAVNMDTGYANLLTEPERKRALEVTREVAASTPFIAGAFVADQPGDPFQLDAYRNQIDSIENQGGTPIIFQSFGLAHSDTDPIVENYQKIATCCETFYAFELGSMFAPFGKIYDLKTFAEIVAIPQCIGIKHSSLDRKLEWKRILFRDRTRRDFKILTGNDLAIDMVMYGSDYLLGLSAFAPEAFAARDKMWASGDRGFYQLNDILQYLGFFAFRNPTPAYKHSAAMFLNLTGWIPTDRTHASSPTRPASDMEILREINKQLELQMKATSDS